MNNNFSLKSLNKYLILGKMQAFIREQEIGLKTLFLSKLMAFYKWNMDHPE